MLVEVLILSIASAWLRGIMFVRFVLLLALACVFFWNIWLVLPIGLAGRAMGRVMCSLTAGMKHGSPIFRITLLIIATALVAVSLFWILEHYDKPHPKTAKDILEERFRRINESIRGTH